MHEGTLARWRRRAVGTALAVLRCGGYQVEGDDVDAVVHGPEEVEQQEDVSERLARLGAEASKGVSEGVSE